MTNASLAVVTFISDIQPHPKADRLELLTLLEGKVKIVAGKHYMIGQRGVYIRTGALLPGYLAEEMWLVGRGGSNEWYQVPHKIMRGVDSPGLFAGEIWREDAEHEWKPWPMFRTYWEFGEDVSAYLGIRSAVTPWNRTGPQTTPEHKQRLDVVATDACKATVAE